MQVSSIVIVSLYGHAIAVVRTPHSSHALADTSDWLVNLLDLLTTGVS